MTACICDWYTGLTCDVVGADCALEQEGEKVSLVAYCQTAQRMGATKAQALDAYRTAGNEISGRAFSRAWKTAKIVEELFNEYGVIRSPIVERKSLDNGGNTL